MVIVHQHGVKVLERNVVFTEIRHEPAYIGIQFMGGVKPSFDLQLTNTRPGKSDETNILL